MVPEKQKNLIVYIDNFRNIKYTYVQKKAI